MELDTPKPFLGFTTRKRLGYYSELGIVECGAVECGWWSDFWGIYQRRQLAGRHGTIKMKFYSSPPSRTDPQAICRNKFVDAMSAWADLTTEQKNVYNKKGDVRHLWGRNYFVKEYMLSH